MQYAFKASGFVPPPDLDDYAQTTVLFDLWRPRATTPSLAITVIRVPGAGERYRCRVSARDTQRRLSAEAIGGDAFEAVRTASAVLAARHEDPAAGSSARAVARQSVGAPSVTHPCEAS